MHQSASEIGYYFFLPKRQLYRGQLPAPSSGTLDRLVDTAKDYARHATAENTNAAYKTDWAHFSSWYRRRGVEVIPPQAELIGLYIAECASPTPPAKPLTVATIERRFSGLAWHYQQRDFSLDRKDRHIATVLTGIKRKHARPSVQKEARSSSKTEVVSKIRTSCMDIAKQFAI